MALSMGRLVQYIITQIIMIAVAALIFLVICRKADVHFNGIDPKADSSLLHAYFTRMYFSLSASSTTGFGDIAPKSVLARFLTMVLILAAASNMASILYHATVTTLKSL